jgi:LysR family transcriptional regulator of gallate degradation
LVFTPIIDRSFVRRTSAKVKPVHQRDKVIDRTHGGALGINLRHLRAFSAVAAAGSVAKAAEEQLYRVASGVTRSISELENALGRPLFERRSRGMALNSYGDLVLVRARRIEHEFEDARAQLVARGGIGASADVPSLFASILNGRRLAVIASLVEKRNMPVVAREFGITQPAISSALKDLEGGLGVALLERKARGLWPTPAGEIVAFYFKRVLAELRHIVPDLAASEGTLQGSVTVGALPLGRTQILPLAIASLLARHPGLHVATVESPYDALAASLRSGDIDFILGALRSTAEAKDLQQEALFEDRISPAIRWRASRTSTSMHCGGRPGRSRGTARRRASCSNAFSRRRGKRLRFPRSRPATSPCCAACCWKATC